MTGAWWGEDVGVADAQLEVKEAGGGGDAAVPGVGLLHRVAVLQGVNTHPGLMLARRLPVRPLLDLHVVPGASNEILVLKSGVVRDVEGIPGLCQSDL